MKKPRPQKRLRQGRRAPTFDSALLPTQYRVLMIAYHLGSVPEQLGCAISEHFVVKTTRGAKLLLSMRSLTYVDRTVHPLPHCDFPRGASPSERSAATIFLIYFSLS